MTAVGVTYVCNGATGSTGPTGPAGGSGASGGITGIDALTGTPCNSGAQAGTLAIQYGAGPTYAVTITCVPTSAVQPPIQQLNAYGGTQLVSLVLRQSSCNTAPFALTDFAVSVNGNPMPLTDIRRPQGTGLLFSTTCGSGVIRGQPYDVTTAAPFTAINLAIATPLVSGDLVIVTITCTTIDFIGCSSGGASKVQDLAGNVMQNAQTVIGTAIADMTKPAILSTTTLNATTIRVTYAEPVLCGTGNSLSFNTASFLQQFAINVGGFQRTPASVTCPANSSIGATRITLIAPIDISAGGSIDYQESATASERIKDVSGNNALSPQTAALAALAPATPPVITDAHVTVNLGGSNFGDPGDAFTLAFDEQMINNTVGPQIQTLDNDPGLNRDLFTWVCGSGGVSCTWDSARTLLTVTVNQPGLFGSFGGSTPGLQLPLTITSTTGVLDNDDGVAPNLNLSDTVINQTVTPVVTPPSITDAHVTANVGAITFGDVGDAFSLTFNELMNDVTTIQIQTTDNDPGATKGTGNWVCGTNVSCSWNPAHTGLTVSVTSTTPPAASSSDGSTPGLQLPLTITSISGATDFDDSVGPNLATSDTIIQAPAGPQLTAPAGTMLVSVLLGQSYCTTASLTIPDFNVTVNGSPMTITEIRRPQGTNLTTLATCDAARGASAGQNLSSFTAINLAISTALSNGDSVTATITCTATDALGCSAGGASKIQDLSGNVLPGVVTATGIATPDVTMPSIASTIALNANTIRLTYSEPILCGPNNVMAFTSSSSFLQQFTITVGATSFTPIAVTCPASIAIGATRLTLNLPADVSAGGSVSYQQSLTPSERILDLSGNPAMSPQTIAFAAVPTPTPPVITDAHVTTNSGSSNFGDIGDAFSLTFDEQMSSNTSGLSVQTLDNDPGPTRDIFTWTCGTNVNCIWNPVRTTLTVTLTTATTGGTGSTPGLQLPLTITATTGIFDNDDGVAPNLAVSDTLIN